MKTTNSGTIKRKVTRGKKGKVSPSSTKEVESARIGETSEEKTLCLTFEEREQRIASAAYCRAEQRYFENGCAIDDWLAAESEINATYLIETPKG